MEGFTAAHLWLSKQCEGFTKTNTKDYSLLSKDFSLKKI